MSQVDQPVAISEFFEQAQIFVRELVSRISVNTVILDDWHSDENKTGGRLIYGSEHVRKCTCNCLSCQLYEAVGRDDNQPKFGLHTSLCMTADRHRELFKLATNDVRLGQLMLNCKSYLQYQEAFVLFAVERCLAFEELDAELRWVLGLRFVYWFGQTDQTVLKLIDFEFKRRIIADIYCRIDRSDRERKAQVAEFAAMHNFRLST
ncbi:MAG: hypothetical protein ABH846_00565 [Patescibacteria group bacterium]